MHRCPPSEGDEELALDLAARFTSTPDEATALIEFGRARARAVVDSRVFVDRVEVLADRLLDRGRLRSDELHDILDDGGSNGKA